MELSVGDICGSQMTSVFYTRNYENLRVGGGLGVCVMLVPIVYYFKLTRGLS